MKAAGGQLEKLVWPGAGLADCPPSGKRFDDGAQYRIEIPSADGPRALQVVPEPAAARKVPLRRISKGSGIMLLAGDEIRERVRLGRENRIEVNLFIGPRAAFGIGAQACAAASNSLGLGLCGVDQLVCGLADINRAIALGIKRVLVSGIGMLAVIPKLKAAGDLPSGLMIETPVMMTPRA